MRKKILLLLAGIALAISTQAQFILIEHLHCHGDSTAVLSIIPNWGQAPYSFLWSTGDTTQTIHDLPTGNYICTVTDDNSFDSTLTYFVTEPSAINLVVDLITPSHCDGFNNGAVAISVSGGLPLYNYLWREIHFDSTYFTKDISGVRGGIYSLLIRDSNNCAFFEDSIIVPNDLFVPVDTSIESYVCNGLEGSVSLRADSAAPGRYFRYDWFNEGWQTFTSNDSVFGMGDGFLAGSYTITTTSLTTNIGCKAYTDFTIRQSETPMVVEAEIVHNNCPLDSIGSIHLQVTGGVA